MIKDDDMEPEMIFAQRKINKVKYAQKPKKTDRLNDEIDNQNRFNDYSYNDFIVRNEFSRDKDRIIFSRAFRRLQHKAQVYSFERGDHFRTRLTHTLEVMQIACSIVENLGLNKDLTEAIALGHDIGHAPYGHQGERILDEIMSGKTNLGEKLGHELNYGGFKHNYNSLRVLDIIEHKYENYPGLNLTWQVMDGIFKHTDIKKSDKIWDLDRFLLNKEKMIKYIDLDFPVTLEGQVVAIADEIAQRQHDLDDGMRDLALNYKDVSNKLIEYMKDISKKCPEDDMVFSNLLTNLDEKIRIRKESRDSLHKKDSLIRDIVEYFICDVTLSSMRNISEDGENSMMMESDRIYFNKMLISFSDIGKKMNKRIHEYINYRIINSYAFNRFDGKAIYILRQLFKAYYENPRQMPSYALKRLLDRIHQNCDNIYDLKIKNGNAIKTITFSESPVGETEDLIDILKMNINKIELEYPFNIDNGNAYLSAENGKLSFDIQKISDLNSINLCDINITQDNKIKTEMLFIKCILENHYAYMSTICDFIAGMTDNFANNEYAQLYSV